MSARLRIKCFNSSMNSRLYQNKKQSYKIRMKSIQMNKITSKNDLKSFSFCFRNTKHHEKVCVRKEKCKKYNLFNSLCKSSCQERNSFFFKDYVVQLSLNNNDMIFMIFLIWYDFEISGNLFFSQRFSNFIRWKICRPVQNKMKM